MSCMRLLLCPGNVEHLQSPFQAHCALSRRQPGQVLSWHPPRVPCLGGSATMGCPSMRLALVRRSRIGARMARSISTPAACAIAGTILIMSMGFPYIAGPAEPCAVVCVGQPHVRHHNVLHQINDKCISRIQTPEARSRNAAHIGLHMKEKKMYSCKAAQIKPIFERSSPSATACAMRWWRRDGPA